jgi:molybdate/tungstate transport system substrate-binding protein
MKILKILCAGSVRKALEDIGASFNLANPDISFVFISGGSVELARDLLSCRERGDLFFFADYNLLAQWFRDAGKVSLVKPLVTNSKVLAFPRNSVYREKLDGETWFRVLEDPGVVLAHTAPDRDPGGYRTLLVLRLAEIFYGESGLFDRIYNNPSRLVLPPRTTHAMVDSLHDEGKIDFMIRYRSSLIGKRYAFLELPREINLGSSEMRTFYSGASVEIAGPKGESLQVRGEPILYGVALLKESAFPEEARAFLDYIFSMEGSRIFRKYGFGILEKQQIDWL